MWILGVPLAACEGQKQTGDPFDFQCGDPVSGSYDEGGSLTAEDSGALTGARIADPGRDNAA